MKKKQFLTLTAILFFTGLFMMACPRDTAPIGLPDFIITVTLDKTEVRVGDTVTATVVFENIRGGDIEAELPGWIAEKGGQTKKDILDVVFSTSRPGFLWENLDSLFEPRPKIFIERGAVIVREFEHIITASEDLYVTAGAFFITATCSYPNGSGIKMRSSPPIRITVQQEQEEN